VHRFAPVLAVIGLGISLLHQSSLGATYGILRSRPIWFKPSMPIMFILSAVAVGPAVIMAIAHVTEWATKHATVPHDVLRAIARFSGFGLLLYAYIKMWDLAAVTYYGRSPQVNLGFSMLNEQTPYGFGFWVVEVLVGIVIPAVFFLSSRFNRQPVYLVVGAACAMIGVVANRWNVTVSGLTVPLSYSPGVLYHSPAGVYSPSLAEWGIAIGVIGYALLMLTLGLRFLPLFNGNHVEPSKS
jgi:molybdopterin-containing oxidoreductase family membrane subunit